MTRLLSDDGKTYNNSNSKEAVSCKAESFEEDIGSVLGKKLIANKLAFRQTEQTLWHTKPENK